MDDPHALPPPLRVAQSREELDVLHGIFSGADPSHGSGALGGT